MVVAGIIIIIIGILVSGIISGMVMGIIRMLKGIAGMWV